MFGRQVLRVSRQLVGSTSVRSVSSAFQPSFAPATVSLNHVQTRGHKMTILPPQDPPKQLTFKSAEERLLKAVRAWDRFPVDKEPLLKLDANISKDLGFDSLDQVEIVMSVEDEFGFEIPLQDSEKFQTIRDVFKYICEREDVFE